jgi:hypothetical protein
MSTAAVLNVQKTKSLELVPDRAVAASQFKDERPLLPVVIAGVIALAGAFAFVGGIVALLALRYSGVLAP